VIAGGVLRLAADDTIAEILPRRRGIGGIVATADGRVVVTGRDLALVDADGRSETLYADPGAAGFNDIAACRDGSLVAGVLRYRPLAGEEPRPGELVRIAPDGSAQVVADDLLWPNGIAECADGSLLVSDFAREHVKRVFGDGTAEVFFVLGEGAPDGVALDAEGCLWIASAHRGSLLRVSEDGELLAEVDVPASFVSSLCFAGRDLDTMVVTTTGSLLRAPAPVVGAALPLATVSARLR
jgi:L-arabinonolactonase